MKRFVCALVIVLMVVHFSPSPAVHADEGQLVRVFDMACLINAHRSVVEYHYVSTNPNYFPWNHKLEIWDDSAITPLEVDDGSDLSCSKDGSLIAYTTWDEKGTDTILFNTAENKFVRVFQDAGNPALSADGTLLAFDSSPLSFPKSRVYWVSLTGNNPVAQEIGEGVQPSFSPDNQYLAYSAQRNSNSQSIYVRDLKTDVEMKISEGPSDLNPVWSPDGTQIAFVLPDNGLWKVYTLELSTYVTTFVDKGYNPTWTSDGKLVYTRDTGEKGQLQSQIIVGGECWTCERGN